LPHDGCSTDVFPSPFVCAPFSSDLLSNKGNYPTFLRTVPPKPLYKFAIAGLMRWANWKHTTILSSLAESFAGLALSFRNMSLSINVTITFQYDFEELDRDLDESVMVGVERARTRVVLVIGSDEMIKRIALQAWRRGLTGGWAWLTNSDTMLRASDVSQAEATALNGWLFFQLAVPDDAQFTAAVKVRTSVDFNIPVDNAAPISSSAASLYDAIMLWAMACSNLTLDQCKTNPKNIVFQTILNTTFEGKSGFVKLDDKGDAIPAAFSYWNYVQSPTVIATYTTATETFVRTKATIVWPGGTPDAPQALSPSDSSAAGEFLVDQNRSVFIPSDRGIQRAAALDASHCHLNRSTGGDDV
jgi:hypothetical protein